MPLIPEEVIAAIREQTDIVALIGESTALKRQGARFTGLCPFHSEKTPSFSVRPDDGLYYCFGCQAGGDAIAFVQAALGLSFREAVVHLADRVGYNLDLDAGDDTPTRAPLREAIRDACDLYHKALLECGPDAPVQQYLTEQRRLPSEVIASFRLGWGGDQPDWLYRQLHPQHADSVLVEAGLCHQSSSGFRDTMRARVIFPIFDVSGHPIAFGGRVLPEPYGQPGSEPKYRNSPESPIYSKRRVLYGLHLAKKEAIRSQEIVVCEGYTDVIACHLAGVTNAVATCGTAFTEDHMSLLARFAKRVVVAFDADGAGASAAERLYAAERSQRVNLFVATFPAGEDPGSLAEAGKGETIKGCLNQAVPLLTFRVRRVLAKAGGAGRPEERAQIAEDALDLVSEHPNPAVAEPYLAEIAAACRLNPAALAESLRQRGRRASAPAAPTTGRPRSADFGPRVGYDALLLAVQDPGSMAPLLQSGALDGILFSDPLQRRTFDALVAGGTLSEVIDSAPSEVASFLRRLDNDELNDEHQADPLRSLAVLAKHTCEQALNVLSAIFLEVADDEEASAELENAVRDGKRLLASLDSVTEEVLVEVIDWLFLVRGSWWPDDSGGDQVPATAAPITAQAG